MLAGVADATTITENQDMGWQTVINNDYINGTYSNNTFIASSDFSLQYYNEYLTHDTHSYDFNITAASFGELYMGQLYPAGHTRFRINMSVKRNVTNANAHIYLGRMFDINVYGFATQQRAVLNYYNESGVYKSEKAITLTQSYIDLLIEQFPNGTTVLYNNKDLNQNFSTKYLLYDVYPYNYISANLIRIAPNVDTGNSASFILYNFEQRVPKKTVTVYSDNSSFAFGFDGVRQNYAGGTDYLKNNGQSATLWMQKSYYDNLNPAQQADVKDLIYNQSFELGIHFTHSFTSMTLANAIAEMNDNMTQIENIFNLLPLSWESLGNADNSTHAQIMWANYSALWRNAPNSNAGAYSGIYSMYAPSTVSSDDNTKFWNIASQYKSFNPAYTHSVIDPLQESSSIDLTNFTNIMSNYTSSGVKIIPYARWYYESNNTVQPITNLYMSPTDSYFNINTSGYNATTTIYDPNGEGVWYSINGTVTVELDNTNATNLTINNPTNSLVQKVNMNIIPSSDSVNVTVSTWQTSGSYDRIWTENSSNHTLTTYHSIGGFPSPGIVTVKKNGVAWNTYTSNSTGYITFNYTEGYSDVVFEAIFIPPPPASKVTCNTIQGNINTTFLLLGITFIIIAAGGIIMSLKSMNFIMIVGSVTVFTVGAAMIYIGLFVVSVLSGICI